ncbi:MAG: hemerythrin-like domain-containing protein [Ilumatobacter sp.]|jgi:hemerythrin-like domain-containing protein
MKMPAVVSDLPTESLDLYREVHKGLRLALFELARAAGALDPADHPSSDAFCEQFADVDMMLQTHHAHEDDPLLSALLEDHVSTALIDRIHAEHVLTDQRLAELRVLVAELSQGTDTTEAIYDAVTTFIAAYLVHMEVEERQVMPVIQNGASIEKLMAVQMAIRTSVPPMDMCVFLRCMLPAMNPQERTAMLAGMKMGAPPEIFAMFWEAAESCLSSTDMATVAGRMAD